MSEPLKVAVVGAGSWGTGFACIPASNGTDTVVWARRQELADAISQRHECPDYLPGIQLPGALRATHDLEEALTGARIVVMAIPSHAFRDVLKEAAPHVSSEAVMISLTKGLEQESMKRMTEVMRSEIDLPPWAFATLTGPNLA